MDKDTPCLLSVARRSRIHTWCFQNWKSNQSLLPCSATLTLHIQSLYR